MTTFRKLWLFFLMSIWLRSSSCTPSTNTSVSVEMRSTLNRAETKDYSVMESLANLKKVVNSLRYALSNEGSLDFKEQVEDLKFTMQKNIHDSSFTYNLTVRLNETQCRVDDPTCDPVFDPVSLPTKETRIIAPLIHRLKPGSEIDIDGVIPVNSKRFTITLQTGYERPVDGQLRINVKCSPTGSIIQLESFREAWKLHSYHDGPFKRQEVFEIRIACMSDVFEIYIRNKYFASVRHKLSYEDSTHLAIFGDVTITKITGVGAFLPPEKFKPSKAWLDDNIHYHRYPYTPFVASLTEKIKHRQTFNIKGIVPSYSEAFAIAIQTGSDFGSKRTHLRLLATFSDKGNKVTLSYCDGTWQGEQVETTVFSRGHPFRLDITCTTDNFQISVDDKDFATFDYRLPISEATHFSVVGMINITEVIGVGELPEVTVLDKPRVAPFDVSLGLENATLAPGFKVKVWSYILNDTESYPQTNLVYGEDPTTKNFRMHMCTIHPWIWWNTYLKGVLGEDILVTNATFLKPEQPLQLEIKCLDHSFEVTFFGMWTYYFPYRMPLYPAKVLNFGTAGQVVYALSGLKGVKPPPPPPPPSRVCSATVWYKPITGDLWFKNLICSRNHRKMTK